MIRKYTCSDQSGGLNGNNLADVDVEKSICGGTRAGRGGRICLVGHLKPRGSVFASTGNRASGTNRREISDFSVLKLKKACNSLILSALQANIFY
jgi:hypothetical protein